MQTALCVRSRASLALNQCIVLQCTPLHPTSNKSNPKIMTPPSAANHSSQLMWFHRCNRCLQSAASDAPSSASSGRSFCAPSSSCGRRSGCVANNHLRDCLVILPSPGDDNNNGTRDNLDCGRETDCGRFVPNSSYGGRCVALASACHRHIYASSHK